MDAGCWLPITLREDAAAGPRSKNFSDCTLCTVERRTRARDVSSIVSIVDRVIVMTSGSNIM